MAGKILKYFAGGNTARGFHNLFESNLAGLDRLYILKGGPGTGKSSLMKAIGKELSEKGYDLEYIYCSSDSQSLDGVIIPSLKAGIVDGTAPHVIEPKAPGAVEEYINLGDAWDSRALAACKEEITVLSGQISNSFATAYDTFAEALRIHDEWEKIYIENMNFQKADELTKKLISTFYGNMKLNKTPCVKHRYLGAATPIGAVDFVPNLTEDIQKRYFIKGRPGSGKSTMLKKLAKEAESRGFDIEIYHCGFDPHSLDMIIVRELGLAIFDSTAPHEYFPNRDGDEIVDMYEITINSGTDEIYAEQLKDISTRYKNKMTEAISYLARAKTQRDTLEKIYVNSMDFSVVDRIKEQVRSELLLIAEKV